MCYTDIMQGDRSEWQNWASQLNRWGMGDVAAYFLEAAGPLAVIGAQFIYLGQPFLNGAFPKVHLQALAGLLEDAAQRQEFAAFVRREEHQ